MKYQVTVAGRRMEVEVRGLQVTVEGVSVDVRTAVIPGTPLHHLVLGHRSWTLAVERLDQRSRWAIGVVGRGERWEVEVIDERTRALGERTGQAAGRPVAGMVRAPMPGLVVRVEVEVGARVREGAGLVVVEAMKMQNELKAPAEGRVAAVHVSAGERVEKGAPLVTLEPLTQV